jgi:hypothetical protein
MSTAMKSTGILFLIMCCLSVASCTNEDKREAVTLGRRTEEICAALTQAGIPFTKLLNKWMEGERIDIAALKSALTDIEPLPGKYRAEFEKLPYPENQYPVTAYRTSVLAYLDSQQKLVDYLKVIVEKAALQNPGDLTLRKAVDADFSDLRETQQKALNDLNLKRERLNSFLME